MCGIFGEKQIVWFGGGIGKKVGDKARNIRRGPTAEDFKCQGEEFVLNSSSSGKLLKTLGAGQQLIRLGSKRFNPISVNWEEKRGEATDRKKF